MLQPVTLAGALLCLLGVTAAEAQPLVTRSRRVTVAATPTEPLPEVRVAVGVKTLLLLDAAIDRGSLGWGEARVQVLDVGERTVLFQTLAVPSSQERWVLRVRYADRASPEWAAFALVAHPSEADTWVEALRPQQPLAVCQEQLAAAQARCQEERSAVWALVDGLGGQGVTARDFKLGGTAGWAYRLGSGLLLVFTPGPENGPPWVPTSATLRGSKGAREDVKVSAVHARPGRPGQWGTVVVEAELPSPSAGVTFDLELRNESGQRLSLEGVSILATEHPSKEGAP